MHPTDTTNHTLCTIVKPNGQYRNMKGIKPHNEPWTMKYLRSLFLCSGNIRVIWVYDRVSCEVQQTASVSACWLLLAEILAQILDWTGRKWCGRYLTGGTAIVCHLLAKTSDKIWRILPSKNGFVLSLAHKDRIYRSKLELYYCVIISSLRRSLHLKHMYRNKCCITRNPS